MLHDVELNNDNELLRDVTLNGISNGLATLRGRIPNIGSGMYNRFQSTDLTRTLEKLKIVFFAEITKLSKQLDDAAKPRATDQAQLQKIDNELAKLEQIVDATNRMHRNVEQELFSGTNPNIVNIRQHINTYAKECANLSTNRKVFIGVIAVATAVLFGVLAFAAGVALTGGLDGGLTGALLATKAAAFGLSLKGALITGCATAAGAIVGGVGSRFTLFRKTDVQSSAADFVNASNKFVNDLQKTGYTSLDSGL